MNRIDVTIKNGSLSVGENTMRCYWGAGSSGDESLRIPEEGDFVKAKVTGHVGCVVGYSFRQGGALEVLVEPNEIAMLNYQGPARYADVLEWWKQKWTRPVTLGHADILYPTADDLKKVPKAEALDQLAALLAFARYPTSWRVNLQHSWMSGCYPKYFWDWFGPSLQRIRNNGHMDDVELILKQNKELFKALKETYKG